MKALASLANQLESRSAQDATVCECRHALSWHRGLFGDCMVYTSATHGRYCDCREFVARPPFWSRVVRWFKAVPR